VIAARREQIARETLIIKRLLFIFPGAASRSFSASRWNGRKRRTLELFAVAGCFLLKKYARHSKARGVHRFHYIWVSLQGEQSEFVAVSLAFYICIW